MKKFRLKQLRKNIAAAVLVSLLVISAAGCGSASSDSETTNSTGTETEAAATKENKVVRISGPGIDSAGNVTLPGAAQLAQKQGYFEEELEAVGYTVEYSGLQDGGVGVNEALAAGETDIAVYGDSPAVTYIANGNDAKIFAVSTSKNQMGVFATDDINSVEDLKGKKVCTMLGTNAYYYLQKLLEEKGLSIEDVEIVNSASDASSLYTSGEVDALCNGPQVYWPLESQGLGHVVTVNGDSDSLSTAHVVLGRTEFLDENPEVAGAIVKALQRAKEWAEENEESVYKTLSDISNGYYSVNNYREYYSFEDGFDDMTPYIQNKDVKHLQDVVDFMYENKYISEKIDVSASIDASIQAE